VSNLASFELAPDAESTVQKIAAPQLGVVSSALAGAIPEAVWIRAKGFFRGHYSASSSGASGDPPKARVDINSPFWHWVEYGNAMGFPAMRAVQGTVEGLGIEYEAK
jgi:hypothetical protein